MKIARFSGPDGTVGFGVVDGVGPDGDVDGSATITPIPAAGAASGAAAFGFTVMIGAPWVTFAVTT